MKDVPGFPGYRIEPDGTIWSCRLGLHGRDVETATYRKMRPNSNKYGHRWVFLYRGDGKKHKRYIHRLVLETFIGPCPPGCEGRHLDGNPTDNHVSNLAWGSKVENEGDKVRHGTSNHGVRNGQSKLTEQQVREIRTRYATGDITQAKLAYEYGVANSLICCIVRRKYWAHVKDTPEE